MNKHDKLQEVIDSLPKRTLKQKLFRVTALTSGYVSAAIIAMSLVLGGTMVMLGGLSRGYLYVEQRLVEEAEAAYYSSVEYIAREHGFELPRGEQGTVTIVTVEDTSIDGLLRREMKVNGIKDELFPVLRALIWVESMDNPFAVSKANAAGLMQLMPETIKKCGLPEKAVYSRPENIQCGVWWFKKMLDSQKGDVVRALTEYNAGDKRMYMTQESKDYAGKVINSMIFREWERG
jgi:hypothetical protein